MLKMLLWLPRIFGYPIAPPSNPKLQLPTVGAVPHYRFHLMLLLVIDYHWLRDGRIIATCMESSE